MSKKYDRFILEKKEYMVHHTSVINILETDQDITFGHHNFAVSIKLLQKIYFTDR